jgi:hypothetical protein
VLYVPRARARMCVCVYRPIYIYAFMYSKRAGVFRYSIRELIFIPELHTGTYKYILYTFIFFHFSDGNPCFAFTKEIYRYFLMSISNIVCI